MSCLCWIWDTSFDVDGDKRASGNCTEFGDALGSGGGRIEGSNGKIKAGGSCLEDCSSDVEKEERRVVPYFANVAWRICCNTFMSSRKALKDCASEDVNFMKDFGGPERCGSEKKDTVRLKLVEVGFEDLEGSLEVIVRFVEGFNVTARWDFIVDVALETGRDGDVVLFEGGTEKAGGGSPERAVLGGLVWARCFTDDG